MDGGASPERRGSTSTLTALTILGTIDADMSRRIIRDTIFFHLTPDGLMGGRVHPLPQILRNFGNAGRKTPAATGSVRSGSRWPRPSGGLGVGEDGSRFNFQQAEQRVGADDGFEFLQFGGSERSLGAFVGERVVTGLGFRVGLKIDQRAGEFRGQAAWQRAKLPFQRRGVSRRIHDRTLSWRAGLSSGTFWDVPVATAPNAGNSSRLPPPEVDFFG